MEKITYQKPEFKFNDLYLFDGIAETCWGYGHVTIRVYRDNNGDKVYNDGDDELFINNYYIADSGHCNQVATEIRNDLANVAEQYQGYLTSVSGATNSKDLSDNPFQEFIHS